MTEHFSDPYHLVVLAPEAGHRRALCEALAAAWPAPFRVHGGASLEDVEADLSPGYPVLFIVDVAGPAAAGVDLLLSLHGRPAYASSRKLLVTRDTSLPEIERALNADALNGTLSPDWTPDTLQRVTRTRITQFILEQTPEATSLFSGRLDISQLSRAYEDAESHLHSMDEELKRVQRSFMTQRDLSDESVEDAMVEELDRALGHPPREHLSPGEMLLRENEPVSSICILIEGQVSLFREVEGREIVFHSATVGRIVGLLALALGKRAAFSCRALTPVTLMRVSHAGIDRALQENPSLSIHFVTVLLRSLARRSRRSIEQQVEINRLNITLARERDELEKAYQQLRSAQTRLVESEKMATLGQLAAGIGHELNNPVAAIRRSADFLSQDVQALSREHPDDAAFAAQLLAGLNQPPISTREQRARRKRLMALTADRALAGRLVAIGLDDPEKAGAFLTQYPGEAREARLAQLERYYQVGSSLRNILGCSKSILSLVTSIRTYARTDRGVDPDVDLHEGLEQTLLLFGPRLRELEVVKEYGEIPRVAVRTGEINQVWANLISNAIQVLEAGEKITVTTDQPDADSVRVRIADTGPGIPPENLEKIFEVNFTTRHGLTGFGLGIGLAICRDIVERHGGRIEVESEPGRTCFSVWLPLGGADPANSTT